MSAAKADQHVEVQRSSPLDLGRPGVLDVAEQPTKVRDEVVEPCSRRCIPLRQVHAPRGRTSAETTVFPAVLATTRGSQREQVETFSGPVRVARFEHPPHSMPVRLRARHARHPRAPTATTHPHRIAPGAHELLRAVAAPMSLFRPSRPPPFRFATLAARTAIVGRSHGDSLPRTGMLPERPPAPTGGRSAFQRPS